MIAGLSPQPGANRPSSMPSSKPTSSHSTGCKIRSAMSTAWIQKSVRRWNSIRQYADALSPTNFVATVLEQTMKTGGENLLQGMDHLLGDLEKGRGYLKISTTDTSAFQLGENVATSPGKVVFQNDLMQLIQYDPATKKVMKRPLVIVPPWINKFYILDLQLRIPLSNGPSTRAIQFSWSPG